MTSSPTSPQPAAWPSPLPGGLVLVGAGADPGGTAAAAGSLPEAAALLGRGVPGAEGTAPVSPACLLLDGASLGLPERAAALAESLEALQAAHPGTLAILLYDRLDTAACARLFQAGLFAALPRPVAPDQWREALARLAGRRARWRETQALRRQGEETLGRLHAHRRQLQDQVALVGEELIASQQRLEQSNRELTEHMAQLALLYRFGRELSGARNWDGTLESLLGSLAGFLGARGAALVLRGAPDAPYTPRQTFGWEEPAWERVLLRLETELSRSVAAHLLAPGVFQVEAGAAGEGRRGITALPLEHQGTRLGFLLLLDCAVSAAGAGARHLPFLQAVQVILAEEVAGAQMLDRIRELGAFNARVLETVRSGIWVVDERGRTIYCNGGGRCLLTGRDAPAPVAAAAEGGIGRGRAGRGAGDADPLRDWLPLGPDLPELFLDGRLQLVDLPGSPFARLFGGEAETYRGEGRIVREGGETIPVLVQTSLMPGRGRDERWLVLVAEDLREAKRLEAERLRADALQGMVEMSAALAHEIRNPLMGLSAQAELLGGQLSSDDPRKRYLDVIIAEVERINGTITRLLGFVRPYEPRRARADLRELARGCLTLLEAQAGARGIRLVLEAPPPATPDAWLESVDAAQLKQVLLNLLLNALDAAPAGTAITLALRRDARLELRDTRTGAGQLGAGTVLEVRDAGPGFATADAERLFRPFYSTKSAGTGLGLSICRKIVAAHGGEIRALREGETTVFRVLLPRPAAAGEQEEA